MSALEFQSALARLYLDRAMRDSLRLGEGVLGHDLQLTEAECDLLMSFVRQYTSELEDFASTLSRKRQHRLSAFYPLASQVMGRVLWEDAWDSFCAVTSHSPSGDDCIDAITFGEFLTSTDLARTLPHRLLIEDLLVLEIGFARTRRHARQAEVLGCPDTYPRPDMHLALLPSTIICSIRHDPALLMAWATTDLSAPPPTHSSPFYVLLLPSELGDRKRRVARIGYLLGEVLQKSTGQQSILDLLEDAHLEDPLPRVLSQVLPILFQLARVGALTYYPGEHQ